MGLSRRIGTAIAVGGIYFGAVAFSGQFGRPHGGVASVWIASGLLASWLRMTPLRRWPESIAAAMAGNIAGTVLFGLGWACAVPLAIANMVEAVLAAQMVQTLERRCWPRHTLEMASAFLLGSMLVIPATSAAIGAPVAWLLGGVPLKAAFHDWMLGHAVGLTAFLPFGAALTFKLERKRPILPQGRLLMAGLILATMALINVCVFVQDIRWPLVAPLLFAMFAAIWADALIALAMPILVAMIAAPLTLEGLGPIAPSLAMVEDRLQLGLLYAGLVACTTLPVVLEQSRRRFELMTISRNAAHYREQAQRADSLIDELRRAVVTDPLTGLANRRAFVEALDAHVGQKRSGCLAIIDIDHFKQVNDRHGHAAGDRVLQAFGEVARSTLRSSDMVARIGGEEFAVILGEATIEQACAVCQRLHDRLADSRIVFDGETIGVTISTGIAAIGSDAEAVLLAADRALYQAKRSGRSRLAAA